MVTYKGSTKLERNCQGTSESFKESSSERKGLEKFFDALLKWIQPLL